MTLSAEPPATRPLDIATRGALAEVIEGAKARGWLQPDLRRYFKARGIEFATYSAAKNGQAVDREAASVFAQLSITGLPLMPHQPNPDEIRRHIDWLTEPARGRYDDALFEIAFDGEGRGPSSARLFGLDEIDQAVAFAVSKNIEWRNVYIGAALRDPDAERTKRSTGDDFYVATAVPIDIDHDYDATRARMAAVCDDGLVITTGLTPERRSQHWARLEEPCDDDLAFEHAFAALVTHTGADMKVKDKARIMRLGGTVSFPKDQKKRDAGYCTELTAVSINAQARPAAVEVLTALAPYEGHADRFDASSRPQGSGVEREGLLGSGRVVNGRESHFRNLLLKHLARYQEETGADPSPDELWDLAYAEFSDPAKVDNTDGRWTSPEGQRELAARLQNTFRRLRAGRLSRFGLYSIDTEAGRAEAEAIRASRAITSRAPDATPPAVQDPERFQPRGFTGRKPPPRPWAYGNILMYGAVTGVAAPPGVGKTTFSVQLGIAFGLDMPFGTWVPAAGGGGKVWLYNGEEPREELDRRFMAACAEMGVEDHVAARRVAYNSGLEERLTLVRMDAKSGELLRSPDVDVIKAIITQHGFKLFMIDPLIEFHGAKEDTEGFHAIGAVLREIAHDCDCAVMFFHHTPKAANSDTAAGDMNAMRGGGPIVGVARFVATMFNMTAKDAEEYGIPAKERTRYVRFDDAKANMTVVDGAPSWWIKLGVCIENGSDIRPADVIGVLRPQKLRGSDEPAGIEQALARATQRQAQLDRISGEMARVCAANGHRSADTAVSFDTLFRALDPVKTGVSVNTAKDLALSEMGQGVETAAGRLVISTVPRGKLTVRKVHFEAGDDD